MKLSSVTTFALLSTLAGVLASDVADLTAGSFKGEVMNADLALVEFFAPWCGHCKNLAPHYEEAATELKDKNIKLAKVDCTEQADLCGEYGVTGYPTLKVFRNGVPTDYTGPRKADGIISYMIKQSLPAVSTLTADKHDEFTKADKVVMIAYGDDAHPVPQAFLDYANSARETYMFGQYSGSPLPSIPGSPSLPAIVLYKSFDEGHAIFPAESISTLDQSSLAAFVKANSMPLFDEIAPENFGTYAEQGLPIAYLFVDPENKTANKKLVEELSPIAKEHKGKVNFVWIDAVKFIDHGKSLNLPGDSWPAFVVQDLAQQTKYPYSGSVSASSIKTFMQSYVNGDVPASVKSAPVPVSNDGPVYTLVADGWDQLFSQTDKDVFAEFFAPWCGHCQRLAPIWEELGENYADENNIVIAQMDATENDIPAQAPFQVQGFPTLKFRPAGVAEFIDYNGDRSLESLIEFIETNKKSVSTSAELDAEDEEEIEQPEHVEHDEL